MRKRTIDAGTTPRLLTASQGQTYTGLGRAVFRAFADEIGATIRFGGAVRFDRQIIDRKLDELGARDGQEIGIV